MQTGIDSGIDLGDLRARAERWIADDPDPATQAELRALLGQPDLASTDLADRFAGSLEFGTAGLRGVLGAGSNRMNRAVVARATWGLAEELAAQVPGIAERGVVVGGGRSITATRSTGRTPPRSCRPPTRESPRRWTAPLPLGKWRALPWTRCARAPS